MQRGFLYPHQLRSGRTNDELFNALHVRLCLTGFAMKGEMFEYWMLTMLTSLPSYEAAVKLAFKEVITHSVHVNESMIASQFVLNVISIFHKYSSMLLSRHEQPSTMLTDLKSKLLALTDTRMIISEYVRNSFN